jgi:hypothetical protein
MWIVEKVFGDVEWDECADMDEGRGDGLGDLYSLHDQKDGSLGEVCREILELSDRGVTNAFAILVARIIDSGGKVDGILIPPAVETGVDVLEHPEIEATAFNWTVVYDHTGFTEPVIYQAVPDLGKSPTSILKLRFAIANSRL